MTEDEEKKLSKRKFVPAETWVLPARQRRPSERDDPDARDASKKRAAAPIKTFLDECFVEPHNAPDRSHRGRVVVQAGFGLCVSFVLAACGGTSAPQHVGPPLGDTHVSQAPSDPTVPPPDAADYETPSPAYEITPPQGPSPNEPAPSSQAPTPQPAPQPGVFSPPPPPSGPPDVSQPEIPKP